MESIIAALLLLLIMVILILTLTMIFIVVKAKRLVRNAFSLVFTFTLKPKFKRFKT